MVQIFIENNPERDIKAATKVAIHIIEKHSKQPNSRKAILWEIENWTEEFLAVDRKHLRAIDTQMFEKMLTYLPKEDQQQFTQKTNVILIQNLAFDLITECEGQDYAPDLGGQPRIRKRDIKGTPEWEKHKAWMKAYQRRKKH